MTEEEQNPTTEQATPAETAEAPPEPVADAPPQPTADAAEPVAEAAKPVEAPAPVAAEPVVAEPATAEPVAAEPVAAEPVAAEPVAQPAPEPAAEASPPEPAAETSPEPKPAPVAEADAAPEPIAEDDDLAATVEVERSIVGADPRPELRQLMELAVKHPEIGPPLAELAFKIGQADIGERIVKMGLDDDATTGVEYYAVAVDVARREGRYEEVFAQVEDALKTFEQSADDAVTDDEANRLLHLIRNAFAVLLFDLEDVNAKPDWTKRLAEQLPRLQARFAEDPFFHSLLAQSLWFTDRDASEAMWEKAVQLADGEFAWNARGTWYKDAAQDFEAAQAAYRKGLKSMKDSALLLHNLAQLLTDEAKKRGSEEPDKARHWLREADGLVRQALRKDARRGLRRYIHGTKDRIRKLLKNLPEEQADPPKKDDVVKGRVVAVVQYGAFVTVAGGHKGLLHKSEIAWERVNDPAEHLKVGDQIQVKVLSVEGQDDGTFRIGFSIKQLTEAPPNAKPSEPKKSGGGGGGNKRNNNRRGNKGKGKKGGGNRGHREQPKRQDGMGSLGELLLAKLEEAKGDD